MNQKIPFILLIIIVIVLILEPIIPLEIKSIIYAISLSVKSFIIFFIPFIIFGLLFKAAVNLAHNGKKLIYIVLAGIFISNLVAVLLCYFIGLGIYKFDLNIRLHDGINELVPYWTYSLPKLLSNEKSMFAGLIIGVVTSFLNPTLANQISNKVEVVLSKIFLLFTVLVPLFVIGFIVKLQFEGVVTVILQNYLIVFLVIVIIQFSYIFSVYLVGNQFNIRKTFQNIRNMLPASLAGFSTMSSVAVMPLTIIGAQKNVDDPNLARLVIPMTVNVHLIGDSIATPLFAFAILNNYGLAEPTFSSYFVFTLYFVLAKFSIAAIPGGSILIMIPILENYLGFNAEMILLITALYILFEPVITSANVLGNGGFVIIIQKLQRSLASFTKGYKL